MNPKGGQLMSSSFLRSSRQNLESQLQMERLTGLKGSKSQMSFLSEVEFSSMILPVKTTRPLSGARWQSLSRSLAEPCASMTDILLFLSLICAALPISSLSNLVISDIVFLGGRIMVTTLPDILAVSRRWKSFLSLKTQMEWSIAVDSMLLLKCNNLIIEINFFYRYSTITLLTVSYASVSGPDWIEVGIYSFIISAMQAKIKVVVMSDTHDMLHQMNVKEMPEGDIFIHCGDFTKKSGNEELVRFREFLQMRSYKHKVVIAGNHDYCLDRVHYAKQSKKANLELIPDEQVKKLKEVCTYLEHESVQIEGIKIFGSPYSVDFGDDYGFLYAAKDTDKLWGSIPQDVDILMTHGPPFGILDKTIKDQNAGCKILLQKVMKIRPQFHLYGHIHVAYGRQVHDGITFINASSVTTDYNLVNSHQVFEIQPKGKKCEQNDFSTIDDIFFYYIAMQIPKAKLKVVVMSDTHDTHHKINIKELPEGDIFIHCGDFTKVSLDQELKRFRQFLQMLPYKHKIVIAGNHDFGLDKIYHTKESKRVKLDMIPDEQIRKLKEVCTYLEHESVQIEGIKIFGSPYSVQFCNWGFMYAEKDADKLWESIPQDVDILVTHGPPFGILDKTVHNMNAGCKSLLNKVAKVRPQFHLFGHIHETYGREVHEGTTFINASSVNIGYRLVNPPQVFEIEPKGKKM